ncbi:sensor histidine kinase [Blautia schinkii]|nr:sensor histidine kinase [Blautia schinkii]
MRQRRFSGKLSGNRVALVLLGNLVVIACVYLFFGWILGVRRADMANSIPSGCFTYREAALCLVFSAIINGVANYKLIIRPLWDVEESVRSYQDILVDDEFFAVPKELESGDIKTAIQYLLKQQKLAHEKERIEEKQRKRTELYALQTQIDPHFLYNALDSIRGYALLHDMEEISDITEALSRVFRNMISDKHELLPLRQEADNIRNYMKIQQFRFNNKFSYSCEIGEELLDKYMIPRMVLQPLVENAIMHGLERKMEGGWVKVRAYTTERRFVLTVTDNGVGISEERQAFLNEAMTQEPRRYEMNVDSNHVGIALININRRIKLNFGKQYGISLSSTPNVRTTTEVVLPLLLNKK